MNGLKEIIESQTKFQSYMGHNFKNMTKKERAVYVKENMLWTIDELSEMLHELPYAKTWSSKYDRWSSQEHDDQIRLTKEEYIDSLHFLINIGIGLGMDDEEIITMYREKNKVNYERQENNY
ncbi:dUTPase [Staphylococcus equorum]|uniref:dUTPase n=1 Tax=Staphylococcus equorum TaxID=246432 RepID=A0A9X4LC47_9STAP|nr:dUTPase [Staphylococcus equorum]MDG0860361.1 dUTPase [Staphylococcus equorum]